MTRCLPLLGILVSPFVRPNSWSLPSVHYRCFLSHPMWVMSAFIGAFLTLKRRSLLFSHLPSFSAEAHRKSLLSAPCSQVSLLFSEADIQSLLESSQAYNSLRSQRAIIEVASKSSS